MAEYWTFDYLAQFLSAAGYTVLQVEHRGYDGRGLAWLGNGPYRGWRRAAADMADGARYLAASGLADPVRICTVGWGEGGYTALLSAIERPDLFRCVGSIAGVRDPMRLITWRRVWIGGLTDETFIGREDDVLAQGSPLRRAKELEVPTLLIHPARDIDIPVEHSRSMADALDAARKEVTFVEYERAEHDIAPERYRIDLLARLAGFLEQHVGSRDAPARATASGD
jgi:dipeptidyl aminopeptidase/acylaminoacyl peptidase